MSAPAPSSAARASAGLRCWRRQSIRHVTVGHRDLTVTGTLGAGARFVALGLGRETTWIGLVALVPLFLLMFSGLYMFALPYAARWRGAAGQE